MRKKPDQKGNVSMKKTMTVSFILAATIILLTAGTAAPVPAKTGTSDEPLYNNLFDTGMVHKIDIEISEADWQDLLEHPADKSKYEVSVTIDGEKLEHVSMSTKGNASLTKVAGWESDRYSFKLNFTKFDKNQTYHGLDKMKLSNMYHDPCGMKDYVSYRLMEETGGYAPLSSFAWLKINGEDFGLYLAVEEISDGWIARTQENKGDLYKPDPEWIDAKNKVPGLKMAEGHVLEYFQTKRKYFGATDQGADLVYIDDQTESYKAIFDNAETKITEEDQERLLQSLKSLNRREDLPSVLETDEVIAYFASHNFVMNYDSYTGITVHNYYLYEENGRLSVVAWDYNDGFGEFIADAHLELTMTDIVNWGIDTPLIDAEVSQRPLWAWIVEDETYLESYHAVMENLVDDYFASGRFEEETTAIYSMIRPYLEKDPTFFYSMEECENAYSSLTAFGLKRAESIRKQLDGKLSPDTARQKDEDKIDASDVTIF